MKPNGRSESPSVLVIGKQAEAVSKTLRTRFTSNCRVALNVFDALKMLKEEPAGVVVATPAPDMTGIELEAILRLLHPTTALVFLGDPTA